MSGAVGERLRGSRPRRSSPARPTVDPAARDALPLRGRAVDADRGHAIGRQRVVFALQAVLVLHDISVPGIVGLDIQPPRTRVDVQAVRVVDGIQATVVAVVIGEAVVVARGTDLWASRIQVHGLIIPPRVHVQINTREPGCLLRYAGILTISGAATYSDNAKTPHAGWCGATTWLGHVKSGRASTIQGREWRGRRYPSGHHPVKRCEDHGCSNVLTDCTLHVFTLPSS